MAKKEPLCVASFRTSSDVIELAEIMAKKKGQSKSEFISNSVIDIAMNFERTRQIDTLTDFLSVSLPYITQGMDKETADSLVKKLTALQGNYIKQRLDGHMRMQRHLTNIAIQSYLQNYADDFEGLDGFIINQSLQTIYEKLHEYGLISHEELAEKTLHYDLYMQEEGLKLLHQE